MTNIIIKLRSFDKSGFNGNTILLKISEENNKKDMYISVKMKYILS